jgi:transcriptional regulator with XRE-family HTH domain
MSDDHQAFADWLKQRAVEADYDFSRRGTISTFALDSGNDPAQMSRFLRGQAVPAIEGQRGIARALGVKLPEVMVHAGVAEPEDFEDYSEKPARTTSLDAVADEMNATEAERAVLGGMLRAILPTLRAGAARPPEE